jgi:hypothetical protein
MKIKKFKLGPMQRKWIKALKSNKYQKRVGALRVSEYDNGDSCPVGYCCLGVANIELNLNESNQDALHRTYEELGLNTSGGGFATPYSFPRGSVKYSSLVDMNDGLSCKAKSNGLSHAKIAKFIEENPELVFNKSV